MDHTIKKTYSFVRAKQKRLTKKRQRREKRVRASITQGNPMPRFSVFRSRKYICAQLIDDAKGHTIASARGKLKDSALVGEMLAQQAFKKEVKSVAFDRGRYLYHGHVKALAQGARKAGLAF